MQQIADNSSTPISPSFAGLLAALTAPTPRTAWNNDDLADDVATLSYEHALRNHARTATRDSAEWQLPVERGGVPAMPSEAGQRDAAAMASFAPGESSAPESSAAILDQNKKRASITIRLSKEECEQLRRRAAQAGLTVSAYLRSCTFEAETLRAQVKDVLAELRTAAAPEKAIPQTVSDGRAGGWLARHFPRRHFGQRVARA